jgi:hypothetical protein
MGRHLLAPWGYSREGTALRTRCPRTRGVGMALGVRLALPGARLLGDLRAVYSRAEPSAEASRTHHGLPQRGHTTERVQCRLRAPCPHARVSSSALPHLNLTVSTGATLASSSHTRLLRPGPAPLGIGGIPGPRGFPPTPPREQVVGSPGRRRGGRGGQSGPDSHRRKAISENQHRTSPDNERR